MSATEILKQYFAAFNAGDYAGLEALVADDVLHHVNQGPVRMGIEKFREFNAHMAECYKEELDDIVIFSSGDDARAAAEFVVSGTYLKTDQGLPTAKGQRYELPAGMFFSLKDGKISRIVTYYNLEDWKRQISG